MASDVQICNLALVKLGEDQIISLTEDSKPGRLCNLFYQPTRDAVLRHHLWNFATKRVALARLVTTPLYEYSYEFQLPSDFLRMLSVEDESTIDDYRIEGRKLLTDAETVNIKYIAQITDPNEFDAQFIDALAARLAAELSVALTDSNTTTQLMWQLYDQKIKEAWGTDATEGTPERFDDSEWFNVRY